MWRATAQRCVQALDRHTTVDWVFAACRSVDQATGTVLAPSTFYVGTQPRPLLALQTVSDGELRIFNDDRALECQVTSGLYAGLQNSVIRGRVFKGRRFWQDYRVVEDVHFLIRAMANGAKLAYFTDVHVIYRVHDDNSSASAAGAGASRLIPIFEEQVRGIERVLSEVPLPPRVAAKLKRQLGSIYFWRLGYTGYWASGERARALQTLAIGLRFSPLSPRMWKTYTPSAGYGLSGNVNVHPKRSLATQRKGSRETTVRPVSILALSHQGPDLRGVLQQRHRRT